MRKKKQVINCYCSFLQDSLFLPSENEVMSCGDEQLRLVPLCRKSESTFAAAKIIVRSKSSELVLSHDVHSGFSVNPTIKRLRLTFARQQDTAPSDKLVSKVFGQE